MTKKQLRDALEDMAFQFGYRGVKNGRPNIHTGGLSALESAFEALGWDDPHYLLEEGCHDQDSMATHPRQVGSHL